MSLLLLHDTEDLYFGVLYVSDIWSLFLLSSLTKETYFFFEPWFYPLLFIGGYFLSSTAFQDIHEKDKSYEFYLLPASITEKFVSRLFIYAFIYPIYSALLILSISIAGSVLHSILWGTGSRIFNPFSGHILKISVIYIITQSIFLFGSIRFKKHAFFKIGMISSAIQLLMIPIVFFMFRLVFHDMGSGFPHEYDMSLSISDPAEIWDYLSGWLTFIKFLFFFVLAPFFWIISILRLSESEI